MAKKKKTTRKKKTSRRRSSSRSLPDASGKHLVIVESPTKARTINRYLGSDYVVAASVGHVRDLPKRPPKGVKREQDPVPGVDLNRRFEPTYEVMPDKDKTVRDLKKAAKQAADVYFATDLDREGEAIAWHLAEALGVSPGEAKRVVFNAITKREIEHAFGQPRSIDMNKVDAQQARRILDRIVGYQVSPLLWKKVAGGLSAGRVQSVAVRVVVEREREIEAFIPDEYWKITALLATDPADQTTLIKQWRKFTGLDQDAAGGEQVVRSVKDQNAWLSDHACLKAELVQVDGKAFKVDDRDVASNVASRLGFVIDHADEKQDSKGKGPARFLCEYQGHVATGEEPGSDAHYGIRSIDTRRTKTRPGPPFITSTMQQAAANRLGFQLQRTMRIAQQLYEGVDLKGSRGQTGLITYMRTDSTHLSPEAISGARGYIDEHFGDGYLPEKPNFYKSSNASAQEAHEAIRPTDVTITPPSIRSQLTDDQFKLYDLIWRRYVSSQMTPAQWDSTSITIDATAPATGDQPQLDAVFKANGRRLVFDGFYRVSGVPRSDEVVLPALEEGADLAPIDLDPSQQFTSPPPRYTEASLQKKLEEEGIGRPSTYAAIISTIQDRRYVEPVAPRDRRLAATDLGKVVTDMLVEAFPKVMEVDYTRQMEDQLDRIESEHDDWRAMLEAFYGPFKDKLDAAHENLVHAKAVTEPAPHECPKCGSATMYRFGRNGRFLSCSTYPDCDYAAPIDREGNPLEPEMTDILCPEDGLPMIRRKGRFGPFLASQNYPEVKYIIKLDPKKHHVVLPKTPPMTCDVECPKCGSPLYVRDSKRGLWLSCSTFPKCRGRVGFGSLDEDKQKELEKAWAKHVEENPVPEIRTKSGHVITEDENYIPNVIGEESSSTAGAIDPGDANSDAA